MWINWRWGNSNNSSKKSAAQLQRSASRYFEPNLQLFPHSCEHSRTSRRIKQAGPKRHTYDTIMYILTCFNFLNVHPWQIFLKIFVNISVIKTNSLLNQQYVGWRGLVLLRPSQTTGLLAIKFLLTYEPILDSLQKTITSDWKNAKNKPFRFVQTQS